MSELNIAKELAEYALHTPAGRVAGDKLLELGRRLLQTVHWHGASLADVLKPVAPLSADDLATASKIASTAAKRIGAWYPKVSPELGTYLTDPNVVLTIGDARGQTELGGKTSIEEIAQLNELSSKVGILFKPYFKSPDLLASDKAEESLIDLTSRSGLERVTAASKLPNIPKFLASSDEDTSIWFQRAQSEIGPLPNLELTDDSRYHIAFGVMKGYPDKAVLAMRETERQFWKDSNIKCGNYYNCAQPNFVYNPMDAEGVSRQTNIWGEALSQFYKSPEHREIRSQTAFVLERLKNMDTTMKQTLGMNSHIGAGSPESPRSFERLLSEMDAWRKSLAQLR